jgi:murein L,D-transpeptidase YafK
MMSLSSKFKHLGAPLGRIALVALSASLLSACQDTGVNGKAFRPIPSATLALMEQKGTTRQAPILIRAFKKEAELEVWKLKADGEYTLLKSFPMCRWSGQLGPKRQEGDRQVPEGFYTITPGQMNPNSQYYLSFNVGYPNALDRAQGFTGGAIMVHGACSSAGCFSMTDQQIEEIYAIAREAFAGGQRAIQMQSYPFRMTPENLARHRLDPNMPFWKTLKEGNDRFEVTKREPNVSYCGRRYVFDATSAVPGLTLEATAACPPLKQDQDVVARVSQKQKRDEAKVAELVSGGVTPIKMVYRDGGQHPTMASVMEVSRPEALEQGPVEIALDAKGRPMPAVVQVASRQPKADAVQPANVKIAAVVKTEPAAKSEPAAKAEPAAKTGAKPAAPRAASASKPAPAPASSVAAKVDEPKPSVLKRWMGYVIPGGKEEAAQETSAPSPRAAAPSKPQASLDRPVRVAGRLVD